MKKLLSVILFVGLFYCNSEGSKKSLDNQVQASTLKQEGQDAVFDSRCAEVGEPLREPDVSGFDNNPPTVSSIRFGKREYSSSDLAVLLFEAEDDLSGISHLAGVVIENEFGENPVDTILGNGMLYLLKDGVLCSDERELGSFSRPGEYVLTSFSLYDNAGNSRDYVADGNQNFYEGTTLPVIRFRYLNPQ